LFVGDLSPDVDDATLDTTFRTYYPSTKNAKVCLRLSTLKCTRAPVNMHEANGQEHYAHAHYAHARGTQIMRTPFVPACLHIYRQS
jgi:hypothetical protein